MQQLIASYCDAAELLEAGCTLEEVTENYQLDAIKWTPTLKQALRRGEKIAFDESRIREVLYRPFAKLWLYDDSRILAEIKTISAMFPRDEVIAPTPPPQTSEGSDPLRSHPATSLRGHRYEQAHRPPRHWADPSMHPPAAAILVSGTSNMIFQALATKTLPDLAAIRGSRQTRALPRRRSRHP